MSRIRLNYDDGSGIDFNDEVDALYHLKVNSYAGVVDIREEGTGKVVATRKQLLDKLEATAHIDVGIPQNPGPHNRDHLAKELGASHG